MPFTATWMGLEIIILSEVRQRKTNVILYQFITSVQLLSHVRLFATPWTVACQADISSPVATAEFSKFAGILSAALLQHHHSGFEIAQPEFYHLH